MHRPNPSQLELDRRRKRRVRWAGALATFGAAVMSLLVLAPSATADDDPFGKWCQGDQVVRMGDVLIPSVQKRVGEKHELEVAATPPTPLSPGTYRVTLVAADEHVEDQDDESFFVRWFTENGEELDSTPTPDLDRGAAEETAGYWVAAFELDAPLVVPPGSSITFVQPRLIAGGHSVVAVCAMLDRVDDPIVSIDIEKATNGEDADTAPGPALAVGSSVAWTYAVTNIGTTRLTDVAVTDDRDVAVSCPQSTLAPGESMVCEGAGIATLGQYANLGIATGTGPGRDVARDEDASHYLGVPPGLELRKTTNGADAGDPSGVDVPRIEPGQAVTWTYEVTNSGTAAITGVIVEDDRIGGIPGPAFGDTNEDGMLDPGERWVYEYESVAETLTSERSDVVPGCAGPDGSTRPTYRNTATVTGSIDTATAAASDQSHYCNPLEPGGPRPEIILSDTVAAGDLLFPGTDFDFVVYVANLGESITEPTALTLRLRGDDARRVVLSPAAFATASAIPGACVVTGADMAVASLQPGDVATCLIPARIADDAVAVRTVIGQVWEGEKLRDEEPVLLGLAVGRPPVALPAEAVEVRDDSELADAISLAPALPPGALPATGQHSDRLALIGLFLLTVGTALVIGTRKHARPGPEVQG